MAALAYDKLNRLRGAINAPVLRPLPQDARFESQLESPTITLPDDLMEQAAKSLANDEISFRYLPQPTLEERRRMAETLDGSPQRIEREIWRDRIQSEDRRAAACKQSLESSVTEFITQKQQQVDTDGLTVGRVHKLQMYLQHFYDWLGQKTDVTEIDSAVLRKYHATLLENVTQGVWATSTARHYIVAVKGFVRWLWQVEAIPTLPRVLDGRSPVLNINAAPPPAVEFTLDEIQLIIKQSPERMKLYVLLMQLWNDSEGYCRSAQD